MKDFNDSRSDLISETETGTVGESGHYYKEVHQSPKRQENRTPKDRKMSLQFTTTTQDSVSSNIDYVQAIVRSRRNDVI